MCGPNACRPGGGPMLARLFSYHRMSGRASVGARLISGRRRCCGRWSRFRRRSGAHGSSRPPGDRCGGSRPQPTAAAPPFRPPRLISQFVGYQPHQQREVDYPEHAVQHNVTSVKTERRRFSPRRGDTAEKQQHQVGDCTHCSNSYCRAAITDSSNGRHPERQQDRAVRRSRCQAKNWGAGASGMRMQGDRNQPGNAERAHQHALCQQEPAPAMETPRIHGDPAQSRRHTGNVARRNRHPRPFALAAGSATGLPASTRSTPAVLACRRRLSPRGWARRRSRKAREDVAAD